MKIRNQIIRSTMTVVLRGSAFLARRPELNWLTRIWMRSLAGLTVVTKGIRPQGTLAGLGSMWQRGFPAAKQVPLTEVNEKTVFAEIHTPCPLRGTGDTQACYRMMEFDRAVVERAGGEFVVLRSQAEPGVTVCQVAMRLKGVPVDDLTPAHQRKIRIGN
ncbi:MAG: hypothetical protein K1Y36_28460 [Blastocatellia bacterium]|nr:hypothetical protein [Blastocatellia bacterium]